MTKDERIQGLLEANNKNVESRREMSQLLKRVLNELHVPVELYGDIQEALIRSYE